MRRPRYVCRYVRPYFCTDAKMYLQITVGVGTMYYFFFFSISRVHMLHGQCVFVGGKFHFGTRHKNGHSSRTNNLYYTSTLLVQCRTRRVCGNDYCTYGYRFMYVFVVLSVRDYSAPVCDTFVIGLVHVLRARIVYAPCVIRL